jgi:hypothetical protein
LGVAPWEICEWPSEPKELRLLFLCSWLLISRYVKSP